MLLQIRPSIRVLAWLAATSRRGGGELIWNPDGAPRPWSDPQPGWTALLAGDRRAALRRIEPFAGCRLDASVELELEEVL
jgi:hypothetical protein